MDVEGSKAGLMICFEVEFPEMARSLARAGADLLVTIPANTEPFGRDHHVFAVARAIENGLPHACINQIGPGEEFTFTGGTLAAYANGDLPAEAGSAAEEVLLLRLDSRPETACDRTTSTRPGPPPGNGRCNVHPRETQTGLKTPHPGAPRHARGQAT